MNIFKHVIDKKIHANIKILNLKWSFKDKNVQQLCHLKLLKIKYIY
jgi:hypothetical protein